MWWIAKGTIVGRLVSGVAVAGIVVGLAAGPAHAQGQLKRPPSPPGARVYFESPFNGQSLPPEFTVRAGLHGMGVAPAHEPVPGTGHHHLLIDTDVKNLDTPLPVNNEIVHFSNGETEVKITLSRGWHKLKLVLADANHMNFDPPVMSNTIRVYVRSH